MQVLKPHMSLNVTNVERSVAFYEKLFGVKAYKRRPGYAKFDLAEPALNLAMMEVPRTGMNVSHFGIQVASTGDVALAKSRFEAAGLEVVTEEQVSCCHAVQDKVWVADPDGNEWEVFVVLADIPEVAQGRAAGQAGMASACGTSGSCTPVASARAGQTPGVKHAAPEPKAASCCTPSERAATECCTAEAAASEECCTPEEKASTGCCGTEVKAAAAPKPAAVECCSTVSAG
jgi:catechol 2,3-dioxygenase-like lactoylglutathione lyase family enzyme